MQMNTHVSSLTSRHSRPVTSAAAAPVVATCWQVAGGVAGFTAVIGGAVAAYTATKR